MNILIINGSPKGKDSTTLQTARYLEALHPEHSFSYLHAGQQIKRLEQDFSPARRALAAADLLLFCYPVYTFLAPYQLHRFMELIQADGISLSGKIASQVTTSKHFYDVTAHRYVAENCLDLGLHVVRGLSADMEDLLSAKGQEEARMFFDQLMFSCANGIFLKPYPTVQRQREAPYQCCLPEVPKTGEEDVVIVTNCAQEDEGLSNMIREFQAVLPKKSRVVNIREFPFSGGCLGCFGCAITGKCVHRDGFDQLLRTNIQKADAIVYAFTISDHFTHSSMKCYDDRQFCNGHRTVTHGTPVAYLVQGAYSQEPNLQMVVEGRSEVGGNYLCGVATNEGNTAAELTALSKELVFAMEHHLRRPANFYGVGGMKIFRDLIYLMQGLMKADHKFYKQNGIYDFPQKKPRTIWKMRFVGALMSIPAIQKKAKGKMTEAMVAPYEKVIAQAAQSKGESQEIVL